MWQALKLSFPDMHWRKQVPFGAYTADFACHQARLVIEVDGSQHAVAGDYDAARTRFLESEGYTVLRFWNNDITRNPDGVITRIAEAAAKAGQPSCSSSSIVTATAAFADRRTLSPSTSAIRLAGI
jgi:very-short-patch-repair endonuclease